MSLTAKGHVYLWLQNDRIFLVEKTDVKTRIGEETSEITFYVEDLENKKKLKMKTLVDSNLVHDLVEHAHLDTEDVFVIKQTGEHVLTWRSYPEEELKPLLEKLREKK